MLHSCQGNNGAVMVAPTTAKKEAPTCGSVSITPLAAIRATGPRRERASQNIARTIYNEVGGRANE